MILAVRLGLIPRLGQVMDQNIQILIVNECRAYLELLRSCLASQADMEVVGEAEDLLAATKIIMESEPDVMLIDEGVLRCNDEEALASIFSRTATLALAANEDEPAVFRMIRLGAKGYVAKTAKLDEIIKAIRRVSTGEIWLPRRLLRRFLDKEICPMLREKSPKEGSGSLTLREAEVLQQLCRGLTNKEIAQQLFISEKTIKSHLRSIYKKLKVTRRFEAIRHVLTHHVKINSDQPIN